MAWFKVDDGFHHSAKVLSIPRSVRAEALGAWVIAGTWSADNMTDGFVPQSVLLDWPISNDAIQALSDAGLWLIEDGGIRFHDWCEYQPTREQLQAKSKVRSEVGTLGGKRSGEARRSKAEARRSKAEANANPEPEPEPNKEHMYSEAERKQPYSKEFETWWASYPRRQQKGDAWKAWETLRKKRELPELALLTDASKKYGERVTDQQFQKLPAGWLRAACWEDEPLNSKPLPYVEREGYDPGVDYHPPAPAGKRYAVDAIDYV